MPALRAMASVAVPLYRSSAKCRNAAASTSSRRSPADLRAGPHVVTTKAFPPDLTETASTGSAIGGSGFEPLTSRLRCGSRRAAGGRSPCTGAQASGTKALLRDVGDGVADLAVVDGVLDQVGHRGVDLADVEADVEQEPLADLALLGGDAVVRVERQPDDLDRDPDFEAFLVVVVVSGRRRRSPRARRPCRERSSSHLQRVRAPPRRRGRGTRGAPRSSAITQVATVAVHALGDVAAGEPAEERLARGADHERAAERRPARRRRAQQLEVVLERLAEADPGVELDALPPARPARDRDRHPLRRGTP